MYISNTSGLIAAASIKHSRPMLQVGDISILKRIVITMKQVGIFPIVIMTGVDYYEVQYDLFRYGVIFLKMEHPEDIQMIESLQYGLKYLQGKSRRVMVTPVNVPMFTPETLLHMMRTEGGIVKPVYHNKGGHPLLISQELVPDIMERTWENGMKSVLDYYWKEVRSIDVDVPGVLMSIHNESELHNHLKYHNNAILHPGITLTIEKEKAFFDSRIKLLLYLIADTHNVRKSCERIGLSYSKAWVMLNSLEKELGYKVVERSHGGSRGGRTRLTDEGMKLLQDFQVYEEDMSRYAYERFADLFQNLNQDLKKPED